MALPCGNVLLSGELCSASSVLLATCGYCQGMQNNLPLSEAAKDPDKYIPELEALQVEARDRLRGISAALKELRRIKQSAEHLEYIQAHGIPRPREASDACRGKGQDTASAGGGQDEEAPSRRERVVRLLSQAPDRAWKARDIANALGIANIKSLRASMDDFTRSGVVVKNLHDSTYRIGEREKAEPGFF
jgi:hypothetical protein